jgi:hypothetical protein
MPNTKGPGLTTIHSLDEVPSFNAESEETAYWATHELGDEVLSQMNAVPEEVLPRPRTRPIAVRFDEDTLRRVKALAARRHKGYQTLLKEFVVERLYEEEKRDGLVG